LKGGGNIFHSRAGALNKVYPTILFASYSSRKKMMTELMSLSLIENALWENTKSRERFKNEYSAKRLYFDDPNRLQTHTAKHVNIIKTSVSDIFSFDECIR
jgi:hypothetical protein